MSIHSKEKQIKKAELSGNYAGLPGYYQKGNRTKLAPKRFRDGRLGQYRRSE